MSDTHVEEPESLRIALNQKDKRIAELEAVAICARVIRDNKDADGISVPIIGMSALEIALEGLDKDK